MLSVILFLVFLSTIAYANILLSLSDCLYAGTQSHRLAYGLKVPTHSRIRSQKKT